MRRASQAAILLAPLISRSGIELFGLAWFFRWVSDVVAGSEEICICFLKVIVPDPCQSSITCRASLSRFSLRDSNISSGFFRPLGAGHARAFWHTRARRTRIGWLHKCLTAKQLLGVRALCRCLSGCGNQARSMSLGFNVCSFAAPCRIAFADGEPWRQGCQDCGSQGGVG